ncbi:MAG: bacteriophage abortive infection AbiH family protein [Succinivibrio sp.]|nr:bacteriophage abortive infection AbiH family protein [Succinivibrio sp.]
MVLQNINDVLEKFRALDIEQQNCLFIIGNGYDLIHGAKSSFVDFAAWLLKKSQAKHNIAYSLSQIPHRLIPHWFKSLEKDIEANYNRKLSPSQYLELYLAIEDLIKDPLNENNLKFYESFNTLIDLKNASDGDFLWGQLELALCGAVFTNARNQVDNIKLDDFKTIFSSLKLAIYQWIIEVDKSLWHRHSVCPVDRLMAKDAIYVNFNYTTSLEYICDITTDNIYYIHGNALRNEDLIIGGDSEILRRMEQLVLSNCPLEQMPTVISYYDFLNKSNQGVTRISYILDWLRAQQKFIKAVVILGHGLGESDDAYFKALASLKSERSFGVGNFENITWFVGCLHDDELSQTAYQRFIRIIGLQESKTVRFIYGSSPK